MNVAMVLENIEEMLENCDKYGYRIRDVYDKLSIFDWWPERLKKTHLMQMRQFCKTAIKMGYTGYVCFKVGATGCANGMWAHKEESLDGYSPDGDFIYRSFTPEYTYWDASINDVFASSTCTHYDSISNAKELREAIERLSNN